MTETTDGHDTDSGASPEEDTGSSARRTLRTAANVLGVLLLIAFVLPFVVYAAPQVAGADQSYVVLSGSMEPAFSPGDVIVVEEAPARAISEGDVITFARSGESRPTTHRVIEVVQTDQGVAFRTEGDANEDPDPALVSPDQVRGKVMTVRGHLFVIPYLGHVIQFAGTTNGFLALVVGPLALLVLSEAYVLVRDSRSDGTDTGDDGGTDPAEGSEGSSAVAASPDVATTENEAEHASEVAGGDADEDDGGITLTPIDLRLTVGVLTLFAAYTVWVAYTTREVWSITTATTVGATLVLVAGMYLFGGSPPDEDERSEVDRPVSAIAPTARAPRRHEAALDGGTERVAVRGSGTPWTGNDEVLREGPPDGAAPGETARSLLDDPVEPRSPEGTAEAAIVPADSPAAHGVPGRHPNPVPLNDDLTPAVVRVESADSDSGRGGLLAFVSRLLPGVGGGDDGD